MVNYQAGFLMQEQKNEMVDFDLDIADGPSRAL
jgi:hypothetical protein